jgi:tetratricopeptide (TPR) repeat protein
VAFAPDATKLLIVNNTVTQPEEYGHKNEFFYQNTKNLKIKTDSLPLFALASLSEELQSKEFFNEIVLHANTVNESTDFFTVAPLSPDSVDSLCKHYDVDVVLSLDRLKVNDKITELYHSDVSQYYMALIARYESQWSIHYPGKNEYASVAFKDTIYWDAESYNRQEVLRTLPNRNDALVDGALYVGQSMVKRLVPYWDKTERYFFSTNNMKMKQGIDSVYAKKWDGAIKVWTEAMPKASKGLKAKLANNIAVAYEVKGNIDKALEYINISMSFYMNEFFMNKDNFLKVLDYSHQLNFRKKEIEALDRQLGQ